jgi:succinate dehydrogenase flavin-adding protein (antitoxin of CptAB toxin-antitoxin module)
MQITYFPYISIKGWDEIPFGDIKVWNFDRKSEEYIPNEALRNKVKSLLDSNLKNGSTINDIGVLSIGPTDFHHFTDEEFRMADETRLILFLSFLSKVNVNTIGANAGHYVATAENFIFVIQNFEETNDYISQQNGFIVRKLDGGYKIGELKFHAPPYVPTPLKFSLDGDLITKLLQIKKRNKRFYDRVLRATDLLFESYFNDPYVSLNSRLLLEVGAFEVLLDLPDKDQRKIFKERIKHYCVRPREKSRYFFSERPGGRKVKEREPLKVIWADKFYTLRNHIIHGEKVKRSEFAFLGKQAHLDIAPQFFILLVKELVNEKLKTRQKYFLDDIKWGKFQDEYGDRQGFIYEDGSIARRLGRIRIKRRRT